MEKKFKRYYEQATAPYVPQTDLLDMISSPL